MTAADRGRAADPRLLLAAAFALALAPGAWIMVDTLRTAAGAYTAIPFWDHWSTVADYVRAKTSGFSWSILFGQSNEHRILFPRLIMFADLEYFRGRNTLPYAGIVASQAALVALFALIAARLRNRTAALLSLGAVAALVFSLGQWENLIWAFQVQFLMVAAAGAWSIWCYCEAFAGRERPGYVAWAASLVLLVVSAFSMANGMFAGAACVGVGLLARFGWRALVGQAVAVAAIAALYFHGYVAVADHGSLTDALGQPVAFLTFLATYLGNPARAWGVGPPIWLGSAGLVLSLAAAARVLLRRDVEAGRIALVGVMAFVVASAAVTAAGRLSFGPAQGLVSRYVTFGALFWAAQLVYWVSLWPLRRPVALVVLAAVLAGLTYPLFVLQARSKPEVADRHHQIQLGVQALEAGVADPGALGGLNWNVPGMMQQVAYLRGHRLSIFTEAQPYRVGEVFDPAPLAPGGCLGSFDVIQASGQGGGWRAAGWAWDLPAHQIVGDVIVIDADRRIVAVGEGGTPRADVAAAVPQVRSAQSGWNAIIARPAKAPIIALGVLKDGRRCDIGHKEWPQ